MKNVNFLMLIIISLGACSVKVTKKNKPTLPCLETLHTYSYYWKKDSLGANGARAILALEVLRKSCDFVGMKWDDLVKLLGVPNEFFKMTNGDQVVNRYNLSYFDDAKKKGDAQFDITVVNGVVIGFSIREGDG